MTTISALAHTNNTRHSERSEESPHFVFESPHFVLESPHFVLESPHFVFAFVVAVASRYPKALALGLPRPRQQRGFSPWGMLSSPSHNIRWAQTP